MLILSRKRNESVMIGEITVVVVEIRGDKVRLGIEAPQDVPVHRREVYEAIKANERKEKEERAEKGKYPLIRDGLSNVDNV